ncbi:Uncharacterised protein [Stenotrophomonas maltophilia]|nr:Uncharacterised protein [Stenotrophomonas maltophilia]
MWDCAHAILYYESQGQDSLLVHENVYLISADNDERALENANALARGYEDPSGRLMGEDGRAPLYRCAGIRKLISVETDEDPAEGRLHSGVEVTYSVMAVDTLDQVRRLARGDGVEVLYQEWKCRAEHGSALQRRVTLRRRRHHLLANEVALGVEVVRDLQLAHIRAGVAVAQRRAVQQADAAVLQRRGPGRLRR